MHTPTPPNALPPDDPTMEDDAPMTEKQEVMLRTLTQQIGLEFDGSLTQAEARERIKALEEMQGDEN